MVRNVCADVLALPPLAARDFDASVERLCLFDGRGPRPSAAVIIVHT
jgi:hypothetical protein